MKDNKVKVEGIDYIAIREIRINKGVNQHGSAMVKLLVEEEKADKLLKLKSDVNWLSIKIGEENPDTVAFTGFIEEISSDTMSGVPIITLKLAGSSYLLDIKKEIRTYQEDDSKLSKIVKHIKKGTEDNFSNVDVKIVNGEKVDDSFAPKNKFLVQYRETNYEFLRRCASMQNLPLITDNEGKEKEIKISIGFEQGESNKSDIIHYMKGVNIRDYLYRLKDGSIDGIKQNDYKVITVKARDFYTVGSKVAVDGEDMYVYSVESMYSSKVLDSDTGRNTADEFWHTYQLVPKKRFAEMRIYNENLVGVSLNATVEEVKKSTIKVKCDIDKDSDQMAEFKYATVYSSNDGSGWYSMPEVGDKVRLYLPSEDEEDAYTISAVHEDEGTGLRDDPEHKIIINKYKY